MLFTTAKLYGALSVCKYALMKFPDLVNRVSSAFIVQHVVPCCKAVLGDKTALPLGCALFWVAIHQAMHYDFEVRLFLPRLSERVTTAYKAAIGSIEDMGCENIIVKIPVVPQGSGDPVIKVEHGSDGEGDGDQQSHVPSISRSYSKNVQMILSQQT